MNSAALAAKRVMCCLPPTLKSLCETGCIFRDPVFRHLACKNAVKTECAAPCYPEPCPCGPKPKMEVPVKGKLKHKYYHEVYVL